MKIPGMVFNNDIMKKAIINNIVIAVILGLAVSVINHFLSIDISHLPEFLAAPVQTTRTVLATIIGSFLTVTIFLYSTTIVVLTTYSAQFTPRVLENFLNKRGISNIFGIFIGCTIYCVIALTFIAKTPSGETFLVLTVASVYLLLGIAAFIIFILSISNSLQVQNLLSSLEKEATYVVNRFIKSHRNMDRIDDFDVKRYKNKHVILSPKNGFFEDNNIELIKSVLKEGDYIVVLQPRIGDFVSANQKIGVLFHNEVLLSEAEKSKLAESFILAEKRYITTDYRYAMQKIVEVAMKALSPAINDPNTAIYAVRHLGVLASRLAQIDGSYAVFPMQDGRDDRGVILDRDFVFKSDLRDIFIQIIHYGKSDILMVAAIYEALYTALLTSTPNNQKTIIEFSNYLERQAAGEFSDPVELQILKEKKNVIDIFPLSGKK